MGDHGQFMGSTKEATTGDVMNELCKQLDTLMQEVLVNKDTTCRRSRSCRWWPRTCTRSSTQSARISRPPFFERRPHPARLAKQALAQVGAAAADVLSKGAAGRQAVDQHAAGIVALRAPRRRRRAPSTPTCPTRAARRDDEPTPVEEVEEVEEMEVQEKEAPPVRESARKKPPPGAFAEKEGEDEDEDKTEEEPEKPEEPEAEEPATLKKKPPARRRPAARARAARAAAAGGGARRAGRDGHRRGPPGASARWREEVKRA